MKNRLSLFSCAASASLLACLGALDAGCGIDGQIWGRLTSSNYKQPPPAGTQTVTGVSTLLGAGASVEFFTPNGIALDQAASTDADGKFSVGFPATTSYEDTIVVASNAGQEAWGIIPQVPAKKSVQEASLTIPMGTDIPDAEGNPVVVPFMDDLDADATLATLLLLAKGHLSVPETSLSTLSPDAVVSALEEIENLIGDGDTRILPLQAMLGRLLASGATVAPPLRPFPTGDQSYLEGSTLAATTDYTGDGTPDTTSEAFDDALKLAIGALAFDVCYSPDTIRVVLIVDFNEGKTDRNCSVINRFKWIPDPSNKTMFITGALHETTPNCDTDPQPCLDSATFDAAGQLMGNWSPNITPMYDDGTHGDAVAGDNPWTIITFDLPWFDAGRRLRAGCASATSTPGARPACSGSAPRKAGATAQRPRAGRAFGLEHHDQQPGQPRRDEITTATSSNPPGLLGRPGTVLGRSDWSASPEQRRDGLLDMAWSAKIDTWPTTCTPMRARPRSSCSPSTTNPAQVEDGEITAPRRLLFSGGYVLLSLRHGRLRPGRRQGRRAARPAAQPGRPAGSPRPRAPERWSTPAPAGSSPPPSPTRCRRSPTCAPRATTS
ncbi:MAG: hypothetical protein U1F43_32235 [Myxococcota bacterium]